MAADLPIDEQGIATLVIQGRKALNIVGTPAIGELRAALHTLAATPALRVLVLRGHSEHAFIGGADIGEMAQLTPATAKVFITGLAALCDAVMQVPVPVVARITGWCSRSCA